MTDKVLAKFLTEEDLKNITINIKSDCNILEDPEVLVTYNRERYVVSKRLYKKFKNTFRKGIKMEYIILDVGPGIENAALVLHEVSNLKNDPEEIWENLIFSDRETAEKYAKENCQIGLVIPIYNKSISSGLVLTYDKYVKEVIGED